MGRSLLASAAAVAIIAACASSPARPSAEPHAAMGDADAQDAAGAESPGIDASGADADAQSADAQAADTQAADADPAEQSPGSPDLADADAPCPQNMVSIDGRFCIDVYEASLVETLADGSESPYPHYLPVDGHDVRALSEPNVYPQGFISEVQAQDACAASGKRLCRYDEWKTACGGPAKTLFPYGSTRQPGLCHDTGKSAVLAVFPAAFAGNWAPPPTPARRPAKARAQPAAKPSGKKTPLVSGGAPVRPPRMSAGLKTGMVPMRPIPPPVRPVAGTRAARQVGASHGKPPVRSATKARPRGLGKASVRPSHIDPAVWTKLNDPRLGQVPGALALTGEHAACTNGYGVVDIVGNLHEWVATDPAVPHGTFAGGYYLDTTINGDGCDYKTQAHAHEYHDYSTGFRCCSEPQ